MGYYENVSLLNSEFSGNTALASVGGGIYVYSKAAGKIVCVATKPGANAKLSVDELAGMATGAHAYYLTGSSIGDYELNNPWGIRIANNNGQITTTSQNVLLQNLQNTNNVLDLSQYVYRVYLLDPIYWFADF